MEGLDSELMDEFLPDLDLAGNVFEDEFMLDQMTNDDKFDITDEMMIRGIKEELESWTGGSSASSSPTFSSQQNVIPGGDSSDEEKCLVDPYEFLRGVVVQDEGSKCHQPMTMDETESRDTPSPGSTSSGCFSDFGSTTTETLSLSSPVPVLNLPPNCILIPQNNIQHLPLATTQSKFPFIETIKSPGVPIQTKQQPEQNMQFKPASSTVPKTVVLSAHDFGQLIKKMQVTKASPRIETVVQSPKPPTTAIPTIITAQPPPKAIPVVPRRPTQPLICSPNQVLDERTYKKQQRLIRNRESANLSRMKKKEFVDSLQETIQQISKEKEQLMNENNQMRTQLMNNLCSRCSQSIGKEKKLNGFMTKKNSMVVLAMLLTVSLNFGPLNNMLTTPSKPSPRNLSLSLSPESDEHTFQRHILWADEEPIRNLSSAETSYAELNATTVNPKCATEPQDSQQYINQTENIRIASELRRWIGEPEYLNLTRLAGLDAVTMENGRRVPTGLEYDENFLVNTLPKKYWKSRKLSQFLKRQKKQEKFAVDKRRTTTTSTEAGEVDVFRRPPKKIEEQYAELFAELRRRDDTFYVVSFNADHLMLPALEYNKTERPKMSLMFPALGFNESLNDHHIMMMQIDCEVLDTTLIQVQEKLIPDHLRRYMNATMAGVDEAEKERKEGEQAEKEEEREQTGNVTQEFGPHRSFVSGGIVRKPYFVENPRFGNSSSTEEGSERRGFD